jgi:hypothetical protein
LLKIRTSLSWDVERFATTLHALENLNFIVRVDYKASCTDLGLKTLSLNVQSMAKNSVHKSGAPSYLDEVKLPSLSVTEPWLPNREKFLRATGNRT